MNKNRVLIIDDDQHICQILKDYFEFENFEVVLAYNGSEGFKKIENNNPDIVLLDLMLPELDGLEICKRLKPHNHVPIIIISAKNKDVDRIRGLELGADDYVTKPFSPKEIVLRTKTVLRRIGGGEKQTDVLVFPHLSINKNYKLVQVDGKEISLTPKEFNLLWEMVSSPKTVFSREKLLKLVWGYDYFGDIRTVDTHIKSLRNKLGEDAASYLRTVWGFGYKFDIKGIK